MNLGKIWGINIRVNIFFLLLFLLYYHFGVLFQALVIFSGVILHEMGHVVVALGYGIKVREIELLPFGGVAKLEGNIEHHPVTETYIALAGPMTSGFLVIMGLVMEWSGIGNQQWLPFFIRCNMMLLLFNLLPALPLDGGRVLRAFLSGRMGLKKGTEQAVKVSRMLSYIMGGIGVWSIFANKGQDINFLVIALFLLFCSTKEKKAIMYVFMKFLAKKKEDLMKEGVLLTRHVIALDSSLLKDVVKFFVPKKYHMVDVLNGSHHLLGTLTEGQVIDGLMHLGPETRVGVLVRKDN